MIILISIIGIILYGVIIRITFLYCRSKRIAVIEYSFSGDSYSFAILFSLFWPVFWPIYFLIIICKKLGDFIYDKVS
jgi:hypothetical protein